MSDDVKQEIATIQISVDRLRTIRMAAEAGNNAMQLLSEAAHAEPTFSPGAVKDAASTFRRAASTLETLL